LGASRRRDLADDLTAGDHSRQEIRLEVERVEQSILPPQLA
jgi:hypothetical protein